MAHSIISLIFLMAGIVITFAGIYIRKTDEETCTEEVQAVCTNVRIDEEKHVRGTHQMRYYNRPGNYDSALSKINATEKSKKIYIATYQYNYQGQNYSYTNKNGSHVIVNIGDTITLRINPNNPTKTLHAGVMQLIITGIITAAVGVIMLIVNTK